MAVLHTGIHECDAEPNCEDIDVVSLFRHARVERSKVHTDWRREEALCPETPDFWDALASEMVSVLCPVSVRVQRDPHRQKFDMISTVMRREDQFFSFIGVRLLIERSGHQNLFRCDRHFAKAGLHRPRMFAIRLATRRVGSLPRARVGYGASQRGDFHGWRQCFSVGQSRQQLLHTTAIGCEDRPAPPPSPPLRQILISGAGAFAGIGSLTSAMVMAAEYVSRSWRSVSSIGWHRHIFIRPTPRGL